MLWKTSVGPRDGIPRAARLGIITMKQFTSIPNADGRLGVLLPGMGAVATTFIAGVLLARRGIAPPIGSLTQLGTLRLGTSPEAHPVTLRDLLPFAKLDDLEFGGWDIFPHDAYETAIQADVLSHEHLRLLKDDLSEIVPMPGAFDPRYVRRLHGTHIKTSSNKAELVEQLRRDIREFQERARASRLVAIWCGSTECAVPVAEAHQTIDAFERGLARSDESITNSQLYAWALILEGVPIANGAPNAMLDFPAATTLARERGVPLAGKDFKTGQTLLKTIIAPGLKARKLGIHGWFSTNILGNRDGAVLDDPDAFRAKELTKLNVLDAILEPELHPLLYRELHHKVRIEYYPPRGDSKEGWDNIDIKGWLGYPMQLKLNFLCRDSILAAPLVLDLALLLDIAHRARLSGTQDWLGFYFKSPMCEPGIAPAHDLFVQLARLEQVLRSMHNCGDEKSHLRRDASS